MESRLNYSGLCFRTGRFRLLPALMGVLGSCLVLAREWTYGVALFWDSIYYISVARHLLQGEGFVTLFGHFYTSWPPLYPVLLAAASCFVFDPHDVAGPVNAVIFGLTVFVTGRYLRERLESDILALWGCFAVMLSIPLAWMAAWALSEPLFILLATLTLIQIDMFLNTRKRSSLIYAAVFTALSCLTRYMGVVLIFTVFVLMVLEKGLPLKEKIQRFIEYLLISTVPIGLWMLNNFLLVGELSGARKFQNYPLFDTTIEILSGLSIQLVEESLYSDIRYGGVVLSAIVIILLVIVTVLAHLYHPITQYRVTSDSYDVPKSRVALHRPSRRTINRLRAKNCKIRGKSHLIEDHSGKDGLEKKDLRLNLRFSSFSTFSIFIFSYLFLLIFFAMSYTKDGIQTRFLVPIYVPFIITVAFLAKIWLDVIKNSTIFFVLRIFMIAMLSIWLVYSSFLTVHQIYRANTRGMGVFNDSDWYNSEVLSYVNKNPLQGHVISNEPLTVYLYNNADATYRYLRPGKLNGWIESSEDDSYFIWFYPGPYWSFRHVDGYGYITEELLELPGLNPVAIVSDGIIFTIGKREYDK